MIAIITQPDFARAIIARYAAPASGAMTPADMRLAATPGTGSQQTPLNQNIRHIYMINRQITENAVYNLHLRLDFINRFLAKSVREIVDSSVRQMNMLRKNSPPDIRTGKIAATQGQTVTQTAGHYTGHTPPIQQGIAHTVYRVESASNTIAPTTPLSAILSVASTSSSSPLSFPSPSLVIPLPSPAVAQGNVTPVAPPNPLATMPNSEPSEQQALTNNSAVPAPMQHRQQPPLTISATEASGQKSSPTTQVLHNSSVGTVTARTTAAQTPASPPVDTKAPIAGVNLYPVPTVLSAGHRERRLNNTVQTTVYQKINALWQSEQSLPLWHRRILPLTEAGRGFLPPATKQELLQSRWANDNTGVISTNNTTSDFFAADMRQNVVAESTTQPRTNFQTAVPENRQDTAAKQEFSSATPQEATPVEAVIRHRAATPPVISPEIADILLQKAREHIQTQQAPTPRATTTTQGQTPSSHETAPRQINDPTPPLVWRRNTPSYDESLVEGMRTLRQGAQQAGSAPAAPPLPVSPLEQRIPTDNPPPTAVMRHQSRPAPGNALPIQTQANSRIMLTTAYDMRTNKYADITRLQTQNSRHRGIMVYEETAPLPKGQTGKPAIPSVIPLSMETTVPATAAHQTRRQPPQTQAQAPGVPMLYRRELTPADNPPPVPPKLSEDIEFIKKTVVQPTTTQIKKGNVAINAPGTTSAAVTTEIVDLDRQVNDLADKVYHAIERRLRSERMRKGLL